MYQSPSYPDYFFCNPVSNSPAQSSPPTPHQPHYPYHNHSNSHLYPPSPPLGSSPSWDRGGFLSPPPSCASSAPSSYLQRSSSALSLQKNLFDHNRYYGGGDGGGGSSNWEANHHLYEQPEFLDFQATGPIRRVFSTGDIQPLGGENCSQEVGGNGAVTATAAAGGRKVGRYSAEERKERIERYRSKRNQRNFQKKITYACRKTLADSRPRIRGRFARNGETELEAEAEVEAGEVNSCGGNAHGRADYYGWEPAADDEDYSSDPDFWANFFNNLSMNTLVPNDMYSNDG